MSTVKQTIQREDGSEIKIVAESFYGAGLTRSVGVYVLHRDDPSEPWELASDKPYPPDGGEMSIQDRIKHNIKRGTSEMMNLVTPAEILKVTAALSEADAQEVDCVAPQSAARARMHQS